MNNSHETIKPYKINDIDIKILHFLQNDGRMSLSEIARQLKVSTGMVRLHYQKMVDSGFLKIAAISNPLLIGQSKMAIIGLKADGNRLREIADEVSNFDEVIYLVLVTGSFDFIAEVVCENKDDFLNFLTEKLYKVPGIKDSQTFMFLEIIKEDYSSGLLSK